MKRRWQRWTAAFDKFVDGKGFALIVTVCVAVITGTAVWTGNALEEYAAPTAPLADDQSASVLMQQSLRNTVTPTPLPSAAETLWQTPLPELSLLRGFSGSTMVQSGVTGVWAIHAGTDLQAALGDPVYAIADGKVIACVEDALKGKFVEIAHSQGYVSRYCGLEMHGAIRTGDQIHAGQTIGFVGNSMLNETDLGPHLHLEVSRNGEMVDPMALFN